ncbi:Ribonuclease H1 [Colletotrichum spinosum]|uniref:Ribonuclease H1 n=1 Tax=Colletotrichum spinosum TaxID=1347390 RepID=A0A4R8PZJ5_9PEZI|nr:Ribonuclease H1 [Colletotrichum spinosum]
MDLFPDGEENRWFDPRSSEAHQNVPRPQLVVYDAEKQISRLQMHVPGRGITRDPVNYVVYIDGACRNNGSPSARASWAVYFGPGSRYNRSGLLHYSQPQTSSRAEVEALSQALHVIRSFPYEDIVLSKIKIATDSKYLAYAMCFWIKNWIKHGGIRSNGQRVAHFEKLVEIHHRLEDMTYGYEALADALVHLGIAPVYHMREVGKNNDQDFWIRAIADNLPPFANPSAPAASPWGRETWDTVLGTWEAVSDFPAGLFPTSLAEAYPDCPVIHTTRSFGSWAASMRDTLVHAHVNSDASKRSPMRQLAEAYHTACWDNDFEKNAEAYFNRYCEEIRALEEGGRRLLELRPGDGWGPLCDFLGFEVPEAPFPKSDAWVAYKKTVEKERSERVEVATSGVKSH